jgi:chemotaxis protein CheC
MQLKELKNLQLDALKEVSNIGAGHAATALAQFTNKKVMINSPDIKVLGIDEIPYLFGNPETVVSGVVMHILGDFTGRILFIIPKDSSFALIDMLMKRKIGTTKFMDILERSCISETGNILAGAHLSALSDLLGMLLLPSVPAMLFDMIGAILSSVCLDFNKEKDDVFCVETEFDFQDIENIIKGYIILMPDTEGLSAILKVIKMEE